ncbi:MAG TPA: hypothetical protein VFT66_15305, partial [Roseiflexaceae bacterium]|nr:hypothetical protein [Roseiflexaceae bacterium]
TPDYNNLLIAAQTIASWTTPPEDNATLKRRYAFRLYYMYLQELVNGEIGQVIASNPQLESALSDAATFLSQRVQEDVTGADVKTWEADWAQRWNTAFIAAPLHADAVNQARDLATNYPLFAEYMQLNKEVADTLVPQFENHPDVTTLHDKAVQVLSNPQVANQVNQVYDTYRQNINGLVDTTTFAGELERYYEQVNGLVANDTTFQQLSQIQGNVTTLALQYQQQVYAAVVQCYAQLGNACNLDTYGPVISLVNSDQAQRIVTGLGLFYEAVNLYWYIVYTSAGYNVIEQDSGMRALESLAPVADSINAARTTYTNTVDAIPQVSTLRESNRVLSQVLRGQSTGLAQRATAVSGYPYVELDQKLKRMTQLSRLLHGEGGQIYLPFLHSGS